MSDIINLSAYGQVAEVSKTGFIIDMTAIIILLSFILLVLVLLLINKIEKKYNMSRRDIFLGLLTQVPILGGIVLFKKLCELEEKINGERVHGLQEENKPR